MFGRAKKKPLDTRSKGTLSKFGSDIRNYVGASRISISHPWPRVSRRKLATCGGDDAGFRICRGCIVALCMTGAQDLYRPSDPVVRLPMTEDGNTGLDSRLPLCLSLHGQKSSPPGLGSAKVWKNSVRRCELIRRCDIIRTEHKRAAQSALHGKPHQQRELQRDDSYCRRNVSPATGPKGLLVAINQIPLVYRHSASLLHRRPSSPQVTISI